MNNLPLVSIIVITYNSSNYVCDTLNSVIAQTYKNIELIISDDYSSDNTVEVCKRWLKDHKHTNVLVKLLTTHKNTGTSGNCNRGLGVAKGEWIKVIAGDDILVPTAIEDYVNFINLYPNTKHVVANYSCFNDAIKLMPNRTSRYLFRNEVTAEWQYAVIQKMFFGSGPTYFIHTNILRQIGGYDERFPLQEDYPLFIKMIKNGYKLEYLDKVTVYYRVSEFSVSHTKNSGAIFTKNQERMIMEYKYRYRTEVLNPLWRIFQYYSLWLQRIIIKLGNSKKKPFPVFFKVIYSLTDPFVWYARYIKFKEKQFERKVQ